MRDGNQMDTSTIEADRQDGFRTLKWVLIIIGAAWGSYALLGLWNGLRG